MVSMKYGKLKRKKKPYKLNYVASSNGRSKVTTTVFFSLEMHYIEVLA
jgi:hypothetical protein